jgi:hypothetical protein
MILALLALFSRPVFFRTAFLTGFLAFFALLLAPAASASSASVSVSAAAAPLA